MTSMHDHWIAPGDHEGAPTFAEGTTLDVGQRRAVAWMRIEPSVAHRAMTDVLVGVVHTADSVRFITVARSDEALLRHLAAYVAVNACDRLWSDDAERVHSLLAARDHEAAVRAYFSATDTPWERDWLVIEPIH